MYVCMYVCMSVYTYVSCVFLVGKYTSVHCMKAGCVGVDVMLILDPYEGHLLT